MKTKKVRLGLMGLSLDEEESLLCKVCLCVYDHSSKVPYQLPCGHTFCRSCIMKYLAKKAKKDTDDDGDKKKEAKVKWEDEVTEVEETKCPFCKVKCRGGGEINKASIQLLKKLQGALKSNEVVAHKYVFNGSKGHDNDEWEMDFHGVEASSRCVVKSQNTRLHNFSKDNASESFDKSPISSLHLGEDSIRCGESASTMAPRRLQPLFEKHEGYPHEEVKETIVMDLRSDKSVASSGSKSQNQRKVLKRPETLRGLYTPNPAYAAFDDGGLDWNYFTATSTIGSNSTLPKYSELASPPRSPSVLSAPSEAPASPLYPTLSSSSIPSQISTDNLPGSSANQAFGINHEDQSDNGSVMSHSSHNTTNTQTPRIDNLPSILKPTTSQQPQDDAIFPPQHKQHKHKPSAAYTGVIASY